MALKTNYKDDVLDLTQNANRKYEEIENQDGSISFNDVTVYEETGDAFGAADANAITRALTDTTRNISFQFGIDANGDYGYIKDGESSVTPFKTRHTETYKPTSRANNLDMGLYHTKRYVDTTAVPNANSTTYTATARGASIDMGATNTHRYVNTNGVPNANSGTYSVTSNGTKDMGVTNTYRYVSVNVPIPPVSNAYEVRGAWNAVHLDMTFDVSQATGTLTFHSVKPNQFGWNQTQIIADGTTIYTCPADKLDDTQSVNVTPYSTIRIINLGAGSGCSQNWSFS